MQYSINTNYREMRLWVNDVITCQGLHAFANLNALMLHFNLMIYVHTLIETYINLEHDTTAINRIEKSSFNLAEKNMHTYVNHVYRNILRRFQDYCTSAKFTLHVFNQKDTTFDKVYLQRVPILGLHVYICIN